MRNRPDRKACLKVYLLRALLLFALLVSGAQASFAVTASVSVTVEATTVTADASATFVQDTHCTDPNDPATCYDHSGGTLGLNFLGNHSTTSPGASASIGPLVFDRATIANGSYTAVASATDSHGSTSQSQQVTIDNTPTVSLTAPSGNIRGGTTSASGTIEYVGGGNGNDFGSYKFYYRMVGDTGWTLASSGTASQASVTPTGILNTQQWVSGDYEIRLTGVAVNGAVANASSTITVDNAPVVTLTPNGNVRGGPTAVTGTVDLPISTAGSNGTYTFHYREVGTTTWNLATSGSLNNTQSGPANVSVVLDTESWLSGDYEVRLRAVSQSGEAVLVTDSFTVDNAPVVTLEAPQVTSLTNPTTVSGTVDLPHVTNNDNGTYAFHYRAQGTGPWNNFGGGTANNTNPGPISFSALLNTQSLADGNYEVRLSAVSKSGEVHLIIQPLTIDFIPQLAFTPSKQQFTPGEAVTGTIDISGDTQFSYSGSVSACIGTSCDAVQVTGLQSYSVTIPQSANSGGTLTIATSGTINGNPVAAPDKTVEVTGISVADKEQAEVEGGDQTPAPKSKSCKPVYFMTGDKEFIETDLTLGNLTVQRTYHSRSSHSGDFGYGWTWDYGWQLTPPAFGQIKVRRPGGKRMIFQDNGSGTYLRQLERTDESVVATANGYRYTHHDRFTVDFDASGKLLSVNSEDGRSTAVGYDSNGDIASVTDPFGRSVSMAVDASGRITAITGPTGRVWSYGYDVNGNLTSVTYPDNTSRQYAYTDANDIHNLTRITDEAGRIYKEVTYDAQDRAITSTVPLTGYQDSVTYNADGTISLTESDGRVVTYTVTHINSIPYVASRTDCNCGAAASFTYDQATGYMLSSTDKLGVTTNYTYDGSGRVLSRIEAVNTTVQRTTGYSYDAAGHVTSVTDDPGNITSYTYDASGRVLTVTDPLNNTTSNSWNANGTLASRSDALGHTTSFGYDAFGQLVSITYPDTASIGFAYDAAGRITSVTDETSAITAYTYDTRDRVLSISYPDSTSVSTTYDAAGDMVSSTDAAGLVTTYTWDVEHRPLTITRPDGSVVTSTFNAKGNLTARGVEDALGVSALAESMAYDADGRLLSTTHADNNTASNTYDMLGRLLTATDEAGKVTTNDYDELGHLISVTNANNEIAIYAYDATDRLIRATAANGVTTTFGYDATGKLTQEASNDRGVTDYVYDAAGNLLSRTDANNIVTNYSYDNRNRLTGIAYPADSSRNIAFTYDGAGRMLSMSDASGATVYSRDTMGRVTQVAWTPTGFASALSVGYTYDTAGRISTITYLSGRVVAYGYDSAGRIASVTSDGVPLISGIAYNALGEVTGRSFGNGIAESRSYDNRGRLTAINAGSALDRALTWSSDSRITAITDNLNASASQSFGYDQADRLTSATGSYGSISYSYDANGNRLTRTDGAGTVNSTYEANSNRLASSGATAFTRDAAGNRLTDSQFSYSYGVNNRLIAVADQQGNPVAGYVHNGRGERVKKTVNGQSIWYIYDLAGQLLGEYDATGLVREYMNGPEGRLAVYDVATNGGYWYHNDHLGTPQALTDYTGAVVWTMSQTPFGIATPNEDPDGDGTTITNNIRFPGQYFDAETGLYYNMNRSYDSEHGGRYTQSDPIGLNGGMNTYAYVWGDPVGWVDFSGLGGTRNGPTIAQRGNPFADASARIVIRKIQDIDPNYTYSSVGAEGTSGIIRYNEVDVRYLERELDRVSKEWCENNSGNGTNSIYSARELMRRAEEPGPYHNFPESFNAQIFRRGERKEITESYIQYELKGVLNGRTGTFEIGVKPSASGRTEIITHRFFRRDF